MLKENIEDKEIKDIGTNGLLKRAIAFNIFNNLRYILTLIIVGTLVLTFSGSRNIIIEFQNFKITIPAISPESGAAVISFISFLLSKLLAERSEIIAYYFGKTLGEYERETNENRPVEKEGYSFHERKEI